MFDNIFLPNLTVYLGVLLIAFLSTYVIGRLFSGFIPEIRTVESRYERIFNSLVLGFITLITLYSVIWTRGNSIFIIVIFLSIIYFLRKDYRKENNHFVVGKINSKDFATVVLVLGIFLLFFVIAYYLFFIRSNGDIWSDYVYYSNISHLLTTTHVESAVNIFDAENKMAGMYNFSELWFTSLWANVFSVSYVYVLHLVTYPYLYSLTILGAIILGQKFIKIKFIVILLAFLILLIKPVLIVIIPEISQYYIFSEQAFFPKLAVIDVLLIFSLIHFIKGNMNLAFGALLLLIPFYSSTAAGVLSGLFILVLYLSYNQYGLSIKNVWNKYTLILLGVFSFFILFYYAQSQLYQPTASSLNFSELNSVKANPVFWTFKFTTKRILGSLLGLLPVSLIYIYMSKKYIDSMARNLKYVLIFIVSGMIFSSITSAIASNFVYDGYQISSNFADTTISLIIFTTILYVLSKIKNIMYLNISVLVLFVFYIGVFAYRGIPFTYPKGTSHVSMVEKEFYNEIKEELSRCSNPTFAYYRNYNYIDTTKNEFVQTMLFLPLSKLIHFTANGTYLPFCMSVFEIPENNNFSFDERKSTPFWKFVENEQKKSLYISMDSSVEKFFKIKSIEYIVVEGDISLPKNIKKNTTVIASFEGVTLYRLNL